VIEMAVHSFDTEDAKKYGIESAILLYTIRNWLELSKVNNANIYDGFYWAECTIPAFNKLFPYMEKLKVQKTLLDLVELEALKNECYETPFDSACWYTIPSEFGVLL
jgi:hypothetical protein